MTALNPVLFLLCGVSVSMTLKVVSKRGSGMSSVSLSFLLIAEGCFKFRSGTSNSILRRNESRYAKLCSRAMWLYVLKLDLMQYWRWRSFVCARRVCVCFPSCITKPHTHTNGNTCKHTHAIFQQRTGWEESSASPSVRGDTLMCVCVCEGGVCGYGCFR